MLAAVLHGARDLRVEEVDKPKTRHNDVLIEVKACGVCMTDLHMFTWEFPVKTPVILGHEFSGEVAEVGEDVRDIRAGDRVAVDPVLSCGVCGECVSGRDNLCNNVTSIGGAGNFIKNGAFAEYALVPQEAVSKIPNALSFDQAAFVEPLGCCIHGLDKSGVRHGETVVLIGAGPIGLLLLQLTRLAGASTIIVSDLKDDRLEMAKKLGADELINPLEAGLSGRVKELTEGQGPDVVIECVGSPLTVKEAVQVVKRGGRAIIFGVPPVNSKVDLNPFDIYFREKELVGVYAITRETFRRSISMLASGRVSVDPLITEHFRLKNAGSAFTMMEKREGLKKIVNPQS